MRYTVDNLGPVKHADINVRPLTVFVGPNNAGKTWTMYLWTSVAGSYAHLRLVHQLAKSAECPPHYQELARFAEDLTNTGTAAMNLIDLAPQLLDCYFVDLCRIAAASFGKYMGTHTVEFTKLRVAFDVCEHMEEILGRLKDAVAFMTLGGELKPDSVTIGKERGNDTMYAMMVEDAREKMPPTAIRRLVFSRVLETIHRSVFQDAVCFPVERSMFSSLPFASSNSPARNEASSDTHEDTLAGRLSRPLVGLLEIEARTRQASAKGSFAKLSAQLEKSVLGGKIDVEEADGLTERFFTIGRTKKLELGISSSMAKELAPIVTWVRHYARTGQTLCIDEPEMNLHPEAQVKLMEFMGMLVNAGLNVMMTTHSSYIVDHLANIVRAGQSETMDEIAEMFFLRDKRAFLTPDQAGVYLFEPGGAKSVMDDDGYIDWDTFSRVSDQISNIHYSL